MKTWDEFREELNIDPELEEEIRIEKELIRTMIEIREAQKLSQAELADKCHMKQPSIARLERNTHSPRLDSILRVLIPLGYTIQIVPKK